MTVRDATRRESPNGHVLYIEELRKHLGVTTDAGESSSSSAATGSKPEVLLIGHDMQSDFRKMETDGIDIQKYFHYSGCVDTLAIIEDTGARTGKSLSSLVSHYGLAELELKKPGCPKLPAKWCFVGSHCAGNDAVATLGVIVAQALDLSLKTSDHESLVSKEDLLEDWFDKPLQEMNMNMILLAYDTEGVETPRYKPKVLNCTSEHGFAWMRVADVAHIPPGKYGKHWRPFFHARHWINQDFRNFKNWFYCVGNPNDFWPQYGTSQYYNVSEGPTPFHKLFEELVSVTTGDVEGHDTIEEVTAMLEQTTIGEIPPVFGEDVVDVSGKILSSRDKNLRVMKNMTPFKGNSTRGNGKMANNRGYNPTSSGNFAQGNGKVASKRGRNLKVGNNFGRSNKDTEDNRGNIPSSGGNATSGKEDLSSKKSKSIALGEENMAKISGNGPKIGDKIALDEGYRAGNRGNGSISGVGMTLGGGNGAKNKGNRPSWAQIATTEHGFAWLNLAEVADISPGKNGINWHPYICAQHWLNWEYRNFANFKYVVGDPLGFWKEFGETQYYYESEGPAPFHQLFRELASAVVVNESSGVTDFATAEGPATVEEITKSLEKTPFGQSPPVFESNPVEVGGESTNSQGKNQNYRGKWTRSRGENPNFRGNIAGGRENKANRKGNRPYSSSNVAPSEGFFSNHKGKILSGGGNAPTKHGNEPNFYDSMASRGGKTPTIRGNDPNSSKGMASGKGKLTTNQGNEPQLYNSMASGGANTQTNKGGNPSFSNSMASGGENATMYRGKRPNFDDSVTSDGGNTVRNNGNEPMFGNNMASDGEIMATKTGKRPSWAQIARGTPSDARK